MPSPWHQYRVKEDDFLDAECEEFTSVAHVTHVENALSILRRGSLRPQLVYDESKLRKRRILVVWLSPNYWHDGFRYGNVSFDYNFSDLVADKHFYWVEAIKHTPNSPTACRILITSVDRDSDKHVVEYDPFQQDGPWWWDRSRNKHFRNPRFTLEFMIESELEVSESREVDFVKHHEFQCCVDPNACLDRGYSPERGGALFVAGVVGEKLDATGLRMFRKQQSGRNAPTGRLDSACSRIQSLLSKQKCSGSLKASSSGSAAVARAAMAALYRRDRDEFSALCKLFKSTDDLSEAVEELIKEGFNLDRCFED